MPEVRFPVLSDEHPFDEGALHAWFVEDGARVRGGQLLAEVRVEDVVAEVVAPADGVVQLLVPEGTGVHQGEVLARVA